MNRIQIVWLIGVLLNAVALTGFAEHPDPAKPNIILFMTDDMGMECLQCYGGETYETPNLDRLARSGLKFNDCYSQPLCTPSRVKIMTGRYNFRNYTEFKHLDPKQKTIGHLAKDAGYRTAVCGKWQLDGDQTDDFGSKFGFDNYCVWYLNQKNFGPRYANPKLVLNGETITRPGEYGPDIVNRFALDFISENKDSPFLLYYPMILPHFPFEATPDSEEWNPKNKLPKPANQKAKLERDQKFFVDMVEYADKLVGQVTAKVEELGLRENTVIMFTSDNGTFRSLTSTWNGTDYKGGKGFLNNQGTHVPLIASWPGTIAAEQQSDALVDFTDFFATVADLTGQPVVDGKINGHQVDGHSLLPIFRGQKSNGRTFTFCHYVPKWNTPEQGQWVRNQNYKLYGSGLVYNLRDDYFETHPVKNIPPGDKAEIEFLRSVMNTMKSEGSNATEKLKRDGLPE